MFFVLSLLFLLAFGFGFFTDQLRPDSLTRLFGVFLLSLSLTVIFWQIGLFFDVRLKKPRLLSSVKEVLLSPENFNFASLLDFEAAMAAGKAEVFCRRRKAPINTAILFYSLLYGDLPLISFVFSRLLLNKGDIKEILRQGLGRRLRNYLHPSEGCAVPPNPWVKPPCARWFVPEQATPRAPPTPIVLHPQADRLE